MKRFYTIILISVFFAANVFAGGILTNTNQSASYVRMLIRDASLGIDAVYYNPAGLTKLEDGFYFSLNNQSIWQNKEITNAYMFLNNELFEGSISAPVFPGAYFAYKKGNLALSLGFNPVGGGGGAEFQNGLPSFETPVSDLVPMMAANGFGVDKYSADIYFEGTSVFWGLQAGLSYALNDMISLYAGGRYVMAKNTYGGHIKNIMVNPIFGELTGTTMTPATTFFTDMAQAPAGGAASMQPFIDGGVGGLTFDEAEAGLIIDAATRGLLEGGLIAMGIDPTGMTLEQAQGAYQGAADQLNGYAAQTADVEVDAEQTGTGITPIFGAHFTLLENKLNIGLKYELKTKLELENATKVDGSGLFPDGAKTDSDMPAMFSIGASYQASKKLKATVGYHLYFDKDVDWGEDKTIDKNFIEMGMGLEYDITDKFLLSIGYLRAQTGATADYNTDMSYSLSTNTVGFGGAYKVTPALTVNLGVLKTVYEDGEKLIDYPTTGLTGVKETYYKDNMIFSIGIDYKLF
ncbi:MAG: aromatic hydrocarbon degradation protein [Bacteroidetes bacterium]|jgi:long-chain fatty acid transport protein|nr:aromatic hydrocarbon degradation protein [Bacteroidota bacterium]MBT6685869.1 aromatic hydrocarbon degradation protein [Bacteroidota bacterium]MBT7144067.1 aromatic hydrocarbon degradation protein [Bacteroidota bacterium]MBT7490989.1 aromatic hydrocarbon degradation protein [Bacteroidota bacterium]